MIFYRYVNSADGGLDTLNTTTPLVNQVLLNWLVQSFVYHRLPEEQRASLTQPRGIGFGIGLAFAIFAMQGEQSPSCEYAVPLTAAGITLEVSSLVSISSVSYAACANCENE